MKKTVLGIILALAIILTAQTVGAVAEECDASVPEIPARPVWLTSHRCNDRGEICGKKPDGQAWENSVLEAGCNAIEVDIRHGKETIRTYDPEFHSYEEPESFYLAHSFVIEENDMTLSELFMDVRAVYPQVCLIVLDVKEAGCMAQLNKEVHSCLDFYFCRENLKPPHVIYSVPYSRERGKREKSLEMFISGGFGAGKKIELRENEGICCDMSNDYQFVESWFCTNGFERCWYGDGLFTTFAFFGPNVEKSCKGAVELRDRPGNESPIKKVVSWTAHTRRELEKRLFRWKCDSVIFSDSVRSRDALDSVKAALGGNGCRFATIDDNPWESVPLE